MGRTWDEMGGSTLQRGSKSPPISSLELINEVNKNEDRSVVIPDITTFDI